MFFCGITYKHNKNLYTECILVKRSFVYLAQQPRNIRFITKSNTYRCYFEFQSGFITKISPNLICLILLRHYNKIKVQYQNMFSFAAYSRLTRNCRALICTLFCIMLNLYNLSQALYITILSNIPPILKILYTRNQVHSLRFRNIYSCIICLFLASQLSCR